MHIAFIHLSLLTRLSVIDKTRNHVQVLVLLTDGRVDAYQAHEVRWLCRICFAGSWQPATDTSLY